ncbi:hypothetical protein HMPREF3034_00331 [Prevotella sp. DNF00663]|nr:hypothetical protein HMPREF3034_00331 [Prevotella sp. DNF00663]
MEDKFFCIVILTFFTRFTARVRQGCCKDVAALLKRRGSDVVVALQCVNSVLTS